MLAAACHIVPSFSPRAYTKFLTPFKPDISNPAEPQLRCALYNSESCQIYFVMLLTLLLQPFFCVVINADLKNGKRREKPKPLYLPLAARFRFPLDAGRGM